jgi:hypothetical protein
MSLCQWRDARATAPHSLHSLGLSFAPLLDWPRVPSTPAMDGWAELAAMPSSLLCTSSALASCALVFLTPRRSSRALFPAPLAATAPRRRSSCRRPAQLTWPSRLGPPRAKMSIPAGARGPPRTPPPLVGLFSPPWSTTTGATTAANSCARGQGATARLPAIRDHQRVRTRSLDLHDHSTADDKPSPAGNGELRRPPSVNHVRDVELEFEKSQGDFCRTYDSYE